MSSDFPHPTLPDESKGSTVVQRLLGWLDACLAAESTPPSGDRLKAIRAIERRLAAIVPCSEIDFFALAGRLQDKRLASATRKAMSAANVARAAPLMASRWQRHLSAFSVGASDLRNWQSEALDSLKRSADFVQAAESSLLPIDTGDSAINRSGAQLYVRAASEAIENAMGLLVIAAIQFEEHAVRLSEIAREERTDAVLFAEASSATMH